MADRYWSFDYGPVHVVIVDQYVDYGPGSAQLTWVEDDLSASMKDWKIIVLHEPGWSAGGGHGNNGWVQRYIQPLCERYGVDIIFCGHNHYYARADVMGVQHITTGGGGAPLHTPHPSYPFVVAAARTYEFCKIDIRGHELTFEAVKPDGTIIDRFVLCEPVLVVEIDIDPDTLNRKSHGKWITVYITLPDGFDVGTIDTSSIAITSLAGETCDPEYTQEADLSFTPQVGDRDEDGILDLTVKFDRQVLLANLCLDDVSITIEGELTTGELFSGSDSIRIIDRGK